MRGYIIPFALTLFLLLATPTEVSARKGIFLLFGSVESITDVQEVAPAARQHLPAGTPKDYRIGFFYKRFHIFFLSLWTYEGKYVVYSGDRYIPITAQELKNLTGKSEDELNKPFFYRIPFIIFLVILAAAGFILLLIIAPFLPQVEEIPRPAS